MISLAEAFWGKGATDYTVKPTQTCVGGRKKACCDARIWRNWLFSGCFATGRATDKNENNYVFLHDSRKRLLYNFARSARMQ